MPNYFLAKTDPQTYSIEDFEQQKTTYWEGVYNYQAIAAIKSWQIGDFVYIYHSMGKASIVGVARVVTKPELDPDDKRKISWYAKLELIQTIEEINRVSLKTIKESNLFGSFALVKQSRLSTMKCTEEFVSWINPRIKFDPQNYPFFASE